jgi:hypothetical protein
MSKCLIYLVGVAGFEPASLIPNEVRYQPIIAFFVALGSSVREALLYVKGFEALRAAYDPFRTYRTIG